MSSPAKPTTKRGAAARRTAPAKNAGERGGASCAPFAFSHGANGTQAVAATADVYLAPSAYAAVAHSHEQLVTRRELARIARDVEALSDADGGTDVWSSALVGISITAGVAALTLRATESATARPAAAAYVVLLAVMIGCAVSAWALSRLERRERRGRRSHATRLGDDIKALCAAAERTASD